MSSSTIAANIENEANNNGIWPLEHQDCAWALKYWDKQASDLDRIGSVEQQERWVFELNSFCLHPSISDTLHINALDNCISQLYLYGIPVSIQSIVIRVHTIQCESEHFQCISIHRANPRWPLPTGRH